jgi:hypothetical protein
MPPLPNRDHSITLENATFKKALKSLRRCTPLAICLWMTQGWFRMSPAVRQGGFWAVRAKTHQWPP